ncbi:MAG: hypothetical protein ACP5MH_09930 [Thermoproteus sp.]
MAKARIAVAADDVVIDEREAELPVVIGRGEGYEPGRGRLALKRAVPGSEAEEVYVFKGVYARFGCRSDEKDCTSRVHVRLEPAPNGVLVINEGKYPIYVNGDEVPLKNSKLVKSAVIQIPGVYTVDGRRAKILINISAQLYAHLETFCRIIQDSLTSLEQFRDHLKILTTRKNITNTEIEDLTQRLRLDMGDIKGRFRALAQYAEGKDPAVAEIANKVLREIDALGDLTLGIPDPTAVLAKLSELYTTLTLHRDEHCSTVLKNL